MQAKCAQVSQGSSALRQSRRYQGLAGFLTDGDLIPEKKEINSKHCMYLNFRSCEVYLSASWGLATEQVCTCSLYYVLGAMERITVRGDNCPLTCLCLSGATSRGHLMLVWLCRGFISTHLSYCPSSLSLFSFPPRSFFQGTLWRESSLLI